MPRREHTALGTLQAGSIKQQTDDRIVTRKNSKGLKKERKKKKRKKSLHRRRREWRPGNGKFPWPQTRHLLDKRVRTSADINKARVPAWAKLLP
jgi:hypothetical protein